MSNQTIEIIKTEDRTRFIPKNEGNAYLRKLAIVEDINYNKYNNEIKKSDIKIGFEFEFYLNNDSCMSKMIGSLISLGKEVMYCPEEYNIQDKPLDVWTIERDRSLTPITKNGFEIVSPKLDLFQAPLFLKMALAVIRQYGFTDDTCGLHFHISSENEKMQTLTPSKLMLFLDENKTLEYWKDRSDFNRDLMDIFKKTKLLDFDKNFDKLSRFYTVVSRSRYKIQNHLEVRAIGGKNYEKKEEQILKDFSEFVQSYYIACSPNVEKEKYKELKDKFSMDDLAKPINFKDVVVEAKKTNPNFNKLQVTDKKDILEDVIYKLEDGKKLVPIKKLLVELEDYVIKEMEKEDERHFKEALNIAYWLVLKQ